MKIRSLITALAIAGGSSSAALADTNVSFGANASWSYGPSYSQPVVVRDHRTPVDDDCTTPVVGVDYRPVYQQPPVWNPYTRVVKDRYGAPLMTQYIGPVFSREGRRQFGMIALTLPTRLENPTQREDFMICADKGLIRTLQIKGVSGSTFVRRVSIEFMSGRAQAINTNRMVGANGAINIDIQGARRGIKRIFVYGDSGPGAMYQIFGA